MKFQVVTRVPTDAEQLANGGNLAMPTSAIYERIDNNTRRRIDPLTTMLGLQTSVFTLGEVLIVDADGRELVGHGRKASKWDVDVAEFDTVEEAVAHATALLTCQI